MSISTKRPPRVEVEKRAFQQVYDDMNQVIDAVNADEATESRNTESGNTGDIRLVKNGSSSKYFIEGKFSDGWAQREMFFSKAVASEFSDEDIATANIDDLKVIKSATFKIQPKQDSAVATTPGDDYTLTTKAYVDGLTGSNVQIGSASDTNISSPASAQMLIYDGTDTWDNKDITGHVTIGADGATVVTNDSHTHDTQYYTESEIGAVGGATLVGTTDEFGNSDSTNVQDVLDDLDAAITSASLTYSISTSVLATGANFVLTDSDASTDTIKFVGGTDVTIVRTDADTITVNSDVDTSSFLSNGIVSILAQGADLDSVNASGGDTLKFEAGGGITWDAALSGDVITVTPSFSGNYDNYGSWTIRDGDTTEYTITSGDKLTIAEGAGINVNFTDDDVLTIANTSLNTDTHWEGDATSFLGNASVARTTLGLGAAAVAGIGAGSGQVAAGDHTHSGYLTTSHAANSFTLLHLTLLGNTSGTNSGDVCTSNHTGAGYLTGNQTITLGGDVSGSGTTSITCVVADDSHNHVVGNIDNLQTSLNAKASLVNPVFTQDLFIADKLWLNGYTNSVTARVAIHHSGNHAYHDWETGYYYLRYDLTSKYRFSSTGQLDCAGDIVAYSTSASDIRLKDNIEPMKGSLEKLAMLTPISYEYKEKRDGKHLGLSAQEVEQVFPEIVKEMDLMDFGEEGEEFKAVRNQELIPVLIGAIKELKEELEEIRNGIS